MLSTLIAERRVEDRFIDMTPAEHALYGAVEAYIAHSRASGLDGGGEISMESRPASVQDPAVAGRCFVPPDSRGPAVGSEVTTDCVAVQEVSAIPADAPGRLFTKRFDRHLGALEARSG